MTDYKPLRIGDLPRDLQPREMLKRAGARHASDDTLLAVILRVGVPGANVVETAKRLLTAFGALDNLARATCEEIAATKIPGIGETKALQILAAIEFGRRCSYSELIRAKRDDAKHIKSSEDVYDLLMPFVYGCRQELFFVVLLGPRNEAAIKEGAKSVIVAHNHPSGDPKPSEEDVSLTQKLVDAGRIMNITVVDHLILGLPSEGHSGYFSMAAAGLIEF